jgi:hypothetical protein
MKTSDKIGELAFVMPFGLCAFICNKITLRPSAIRGIPIEVVAIALCYLICAPLMLPMALFSFLLEKLGK